MMPAGKRYWKAACSTVALVSAAVLAGYRPRAWVGYVAWSVERMGVPVVLLFSGTLGVGIILFLLSRYRHKSELLAAALALSAALHLLTAATFSLLEIGAEPVRRAPTPIRVDPSRGLSATEEERVGQALREALLRPLERNLPEMNPERSEDPGPEEEPPPPAMPPEPAFPERTPSALAPARPPSRNRRTIEVASPEMRMARPTAGSETPAVAWMRPVKTPTEPATVQSGNARTLEWQRDPLAGDAPFRKAPTPAKPALPMPERAAASDIRPPDPKHADPAVQDPLPGKPKVIPDVSQPEMLRDIAPAEPAPASPVLDALAAAPVRLLIDPPRQPPPLLPETDSPAPAPALLQTETKPPSPLPEAAWPEATAERARPEPAGAHPLQKARIPEATRTESAALPRARMEEIPEPIAEPIAQRTPWHSPDRTEALPMDHPAPDIPTPQWQHASPEPVEDSPANTVAAPRPVASARTAHPEETTRNTALPKIQIIETASVERQVALLQALADAPEAKAHPPDRRASRDIQTARAEVNPSHEPVMMKKNRPAHLAPRGGAFETEEKTLADIRMPVDARDSPPGVPATGAVTRLAGAPVIETERPDGLDLRQRPVPASKAIETLPETLEPGNLTWSAATHADRTVTPSDPADAHITPETPTLRLSPRMPGDAGTLARLTDPDTSVHAASIPPLPENAAMPEASPAGITEPVSSDEWPSSTMQPIPERPATGMGTPDPSPVPIPRLTPDRAVVETRPQGGGPVKPEPTLRALEPSTAERTAADVSFHEQPTVPARRTQDAVAPEPAAPAPAQHAVLPSIAPLSPLQPLAQTVEREPDANRAGVSPAPIMESAPPARIATLQPTDLALADPNRPTAPLAPTPQRASAAAALLLENPGMTSGTPPQRHPAMLENARPSPANRSSWTDTTPADPIARAMSPLMTGPQQPDASGRALTPPPTREERLQVGRAQPSLNPAGHTRMESHRPDAALTLPALPSPPEHRDEVMTLPAVPAMERLRPPGEIPADMIPGSGDSAHSPAATLETPATVIVSPVTDEPHVTPSGNPGEQRHTVIITAMRTRPIELDETAASAAALRNWTPPPLPESRGSAIRLSLAPEGDSGTRIPAMRSDIPVSPLPRALNPIAGAATDLVAPSSAKAIYEWRSPEKRRMIEDLGGSPETEEAVEAALAWLAGAQSDDGRWDVSRFKGVDVCGGGGDRLDGNVALTGLSLLAYLGAGYTHLAGMHRETVRLGLEWLIEGQSADGDLRRGGTLYDQAMASAAICESLSLTGDSRLEEPARRAAAFIMAAQTPQAAWRYEPRVDSDTSVLGWQILALKSAEIAGVNVPPRHFAWSGMWLDKVRKGGGGLYAYKPEHGATPVMTAEGWFCQLFMGDEAREQGKPESIAYLLENLPEWDERGRGTVNLYYWYYATLALRLSGVSEFDTWNRALKKTLLDHRRQDGAAAGSWDPVGALGPRGGRVYATAMAALCLEVYYRYLPFYRRMTMER